MSVERFSTTLNGYGDYAYADMEHDEDGNWVSFEEYQKLKDELDMLKESLKSPMDKLADWLVEKK